MKQLTVVVAITALLSVSCIVYAAGRSGGYFPLAEGGTEEVIQFFKMCFDTYNAQPAEKRAKVNPSSFCYCLTDAARMNLRANGKLMPDEEKGSVCREVARTKK